ncbi:MAG: MBG domain-containing protein [Jatrophihabitans sp.]
MLAMPARLRVLLAAGTAAALSAALTIAWPASSALATDAPVACYDGTYTVPAGVHFLSMTAIGQGGTTGAGYTAGDFFHSDHGGGAGGQGARVEVRYASVTPGQVLFYGSASPTVAGGQIAGGNGGSGSYVATTAPTTGTGTTDPACVLDPAKFLVVAGGGGRGGDGGYHGPGGTGGSAGSAGNPGDTNEAYAGAGGGAGTATAGGAGGVGGRSLIGGNGGVNGAAGTHAGVGRYVATLPHITTGGTGGTLQKSIGGGFVGLAFGGSGGGGWFGGGGGGSDGNNAIGDSGAGGGGGGGGSSYVSDTLLTPNVLIAPTSASPSVIFTPVTNGTLSLSIDKNPAINAQPVTITAGSSNSTATGSVTFSENGVTLGVKPLVNGKASVTTTYNQNSSQNLTHTIVATYPGDGANFPTDAANPPSITFSVAIPPSIPAGMNPVDTTTTYGTAAVFSVGHAGFPNPNYQWQISRDKGATWADIAGETGSQISFFGQVSDTGDRLRAVLTNSAGSATSTSAKVTITPAPLTITGSGSSHAYGTPSPPVTPVYSGLRNLDPRPSTAPTCTTAAPANANAGFYATSCAGAADPNYAITYSTGGERITKAPVTITASSGSTTYGADPPAITASFSDSFVNGQTSSVLTQQPTCSTTATARTHPSSSPVATTCSGAAAANYSFSYVDGALAIGKKLLTITAQAAGSTYGDTAPTVTPSYDGFVSGDSAASLTTAASCVSNTDARTPAATYTAKSSCSGAVDDDYSFAYVPGTVTIQKAPLTVAPSTAGFTYGQTPEVSPVYDGFRNGDDAAALTRAPTCASSTTASSPAGDYAHAVTCTGGASSNYSFAYQAADAHVAKAALTITASDGTNVYGSAPPTITARYSGFVNGEDAGVLSKPPTCAATTTASTGAGVHADSTACDGASAANYAISYAEGTVTVTPAPLIITASSATIPYGTSVGVTAQYSPFVLGQTPSVLDTAPSCTTTATASSAPGSYPTSCSGATGANYSISYVPGTVTIEKAATSLTVVASTAAPAVNAAVTYTASVGHATGALAPSGTISFYIDGSKTPAAVTPVTGASFTTTFGGGSHSVAAVYSGDGNYLPSTSNPATTVTVACDQTITGRHSSLIVSHGVTCLSGATISGGISVAAGATLDIENSTVRGSITASKPSALRVCGSNTGSITVTKATGPVIIGDPANNCAPNVIDGSVLATDNTGGLRIIGNTITGPLTARNNPGAVIEGNHN